MLNYKSLAPKKGIMPLSFEVYKKTEAQEKFGLFKHFWV